MFVIKKRRIWFMLSTTILIIAAVLLITGSSILGISLSDTSNVPLGTFITWLGIIALPLTIYFGIEKLRNPVSQKDKYVALLWRGIFFLSIIWLPICYLLAGNISFSFSEKATFQGGQLAMQIFWYFTYFMAAAPLLILAIYGIRALLSTKK